MPLPTPEFVSSEYKLILEALHAYLDDDDESYNDEIRELIHKIVTFHAGYIPDLYEFLQRKGITYEKASEMTKKDVKASEDLANQLFIDLIQEDKAKLVDRIAVDSGQIAIGDCDTIQLKVNTTSGDGFYPVWKGKKYVVIEIDMLNIMKLDKECKLAKEWKTEVEK